MDDETSENWDIKPRPERGAIERHFTERFETFATNHAHVRLACAAAEGEKQVGETTGRADDGAVQTVGGIRERVSENRAITSVRESFVRVNGGSGGVRENNSGG